jgi:hypothetical protein
MGNLKDMTMRKNKITKAPKKNSEPLINVRNLFFTDLIVIIALVQYTNKNKQQIV